MVFARTGFSIANDVPQMLFQSTRGYDMTATTTITPGTSSVLVTCSAAATFKKMPASSAFFLSCSLTDALLPRVKSYALRFRCCWSSRFRLPGAGALACIPRAVHPVERRDGGQERRREEGKEGLQPRSELFPCLGERQKTAGGNAQLSWVGIIHQAPIECKPNSSVVV